MKNPFKKYYLYKKENGKIVDVNRDAVENKEESFELFKSLYDVHYGSIDEEGNLISIHTGGWSENEFLISQFKHTAWWVFYIRIEATGGHYYFCTDYKAGKEWIVTKST